MLLDEPLSALDTTLEHICIELKRLQKNCRHKLCSCNALNQEEAMSVADRIAIIADGEMIEHGSLNKYTATLKEIYSRVYW